MVEVQRGIDPKKQQIWLLAVSLLFKQCGVLPDLFVITARRAVARWAKGLVCVQTPSGTELRLKPVVLELGEDECKALLSTRRPELALFAAWAMHHRHGPRAQRVVKRALELTERLPRPLRGG